MNEITRDMRARWTPGPEQDRQAAAAIRQLREDLAAGRVAAVEDDGCVYTVQLLFGKHEGFWTRDVRVEPLPGLHYSRDQADAACTGALAALRLIDPHVVATASWCRHTLPTQDDPRPPRTGDGRAWATAWAVFEHIGP